MMTSHRLLPAVPVSCAGLALALVLALQSSPAWSVTPAEQVVSNVRMDIRQGDCKGAVSTLNKGLGEHYPEVQMLAGSLYENGACLKANWDRAVHFYSMAYRNGQKAAAFRLAAGFAAPENGPDVASALWWASRANVGGDVLITFKPAVGRVDLTLNGTGQYQLTGVYLGDRLWEKNDKQIGSAFVQSVRAVADRALKRYPKPDGIPADFPDVKACMHFEMVEPAMPAFY